MLWADQDGKDLVGFALLLIDLYGRIGLLDGLVYFLLMKDCTACPCHSVAILENAELRDL